MNCPLCNAALIKKPYDAYFDCPLCKALVKDRKLYPGKAQERSRYLEHNNDVNDPRYREFTAPITKYILKNFGPEHQGLDYGSGTGPVISRMLQDQGYNVKQYDPYFANHPELLNEKYDYVFACEVVEHFYEPHKEFRRLHGMLKNHGRLVCMTLLYDQSLDFRNWYYRKDPTHVFIYRAETFQYISREFGFKTCEINKRLVVLQK